MALGVLDPNSRFEKSLGLLTTRYLVNPGVNKKPKKFKTVWHGFRGILKLSVLSEDDHVGRKASEHDVISEGSSEVED